MNGNVILVVEDNPDDVELLRHEFRNSGLDLDIASTVAEAKRKMEAYPQYRGAVVDLTLEQMNAVPLIRWMKAKVPAMVIVVVTGYSGISEQQLQELRDNGSHRCFQKPFTSTQLRELMDLFDLQHANFVAGKPRWSWRTTVCGAAAMILSMWAAVSTKPLAALTAAVFAAGLAGVLGVDASAFNEWAKKIGGKKGE